MSSEFLKIKRKKCHVHNNKRENSIEMVHNPAIGFPYLGRKTLATATRYLYFGEKRAEFTLLRTLIARLEEESNCTQHTQYLNQKQIIYMFRKTLTVLYMLTFLINLNSTHNDCNIREAFTVLRECILPECLEYISFFFVFCFI